MINEEYIHVNSNGDVLDFKKYGISFNENTLRDYLWKYEYSNGELNFIKDHESFTLELTVNIRNGNPNEIKNMIFNHFETDIFNKQAGYLLKNDYKLYCFFYGSKKNDYLIADRYMKLEFSVLCDVKNWIKEKNYSFYKGKTEQINNTRDYQYDYPYDYYVDLSSGTIENDGVSNCDFNLVIFGPCINPMVTIDNHIYSANIELLNSERLVINSKEKKIYKLKKDGTKINAFNSQNDYYYIFESIKSGIHNLSWSGDFGFNLTLVIERSELEWI